MNFAARRRCQFAIAGAVGAMFSGAQVYACSGIPCAPSTCVAVSQAMTHAASPPPSPAPGGNPGLASNPISRNMTLMAQMPLSTIGGGEGASLFGWTDPLTKREYAIMGRTNGTAFVDITNPRAPKYVAELPKIAGSASTLWREPKVYQNTVYIGVDGTSVGMQVMDLTKLRAYSGTTLQLTANSVYNGVSQIHTLAINPTSGHLYLAGTNANGGGLRVLNVSNNPLAPTAVGNTTLDGYTHETQVVTYSGPDSQHVGKEIAFNSNGPNGVLSILDVTNKSNITRLAARTYTGERYIHQGWLTEDQKYFFQNDEGDEPGTAPRTRTHLWNVSDLDNPVYRGFFEHQTTAIDHNLYVKDGFVFESNYTTGLRMLKIGNLESTNPNDWLTEVAYYDTYAPNDAASFNGAWNNYPYFNSGNVPVSDINGGLFIFQPNVSGWDLNPWDPRGGGGGGLPNQSPEPGAATALIGAAVFGVARRRAR